MNFSLSNIQKLLLKLLYLGFLSTLGHSSASAAFLRADKYLQQVELCELPGGKRKKKTTLASKFTVSLKTLQHHESCESLIKMKREFSKEENKISFFNGLFLF